MRKTDLDNKLMSFNRTFFSNKTKYLEIQKKLNRLTTKDYNFFLGRLYFASNDGLQNMFVYQPTFDTLELKKGEGTDYVYTSKLKPLYTAFLHNFLDIA